MLLFDFCTEIIWHPVLQKTNSKHFNFVRWPTIYNKYIIVMWNTKLRYWSTKVFPEITNITTLRTKSKLWLITSASSTLKDKISSGEVSSSKILYDEKKHTSKYSTRLIHMEKRITKYNNGYNKHEK